MNRGTEKRYARVMTVTVVFFRCFNHERMGNTGSFWFILLFNLLYGSGVRSKSFIMTKLHILRD